MLFSVGCRFSVVLFSVGCVPYGLVLFSVGCRFSVVLFSVGCRVLWASVI